MKTTHMTSGQAIILGDGETATFSCCDCSLAHDLTVKIDPDTMKVSIEVEANGRATAAARRSKIGKAALKELWAKLNQRA